MDGLPSRRHFLGAVGTGVTAGLAGCVGILGGDSTDGEDDDGDEDDPEPTLNTLSEEREFTAELPDSVSLEGVADGLDVPTDIVFLPDADIRYVSERAGRIRVHDAEGLREEPLLEYRDTVELGGERGLLGLELHPEFEENGRLFVRYSAEVREWSPEEYSHTFVLSSFEVSEDRRSLDPETERIVMEIAQPHENHNAGDIAFGPDGYLYVPTGDGGESRDRAPDHPDDWYDENEGGNGQDTTEFLLGGLLRIDVDADPTEHYRTDEDAPEEPDGDGGYAIPDDNPLVGAEGHRDEYYAWGMRNPFRISFDGEDLYVGDVGQAQWEWVNLVEKGENYGWNVKEGSHCLDASYVFDTPPECPDSTPDDVRGGEALRDPVFEYPNTRNRQLDTEKYETGIAVMGGYVYRGAELPALDGLYVFGDMQVEGRLFVGEPRPGEDRPWPMTTLPLGEDSVEKLLSLTSFARDEEGELYALGDGRVHRLVSETDG